MVKSDTNTKPMPPTWRVFIRSRGHLLWISENELFWMRHSDQKKTFPMGRLKQEDFIFMCKVLASDHNPTKSELVALKDWAP